MFTSVEGQTSDIIMTVTSTATKYSDLHKWFSHDSSTFRAGCLFQGVCETGEWIVHYSTFFKEPGLAWPEQEWCISGRILCWFHIRKVSTSGFVQYSKQSRQADHYPSLVMFFNILRRPALSTWLTSPTAMALLQASAGRKTKPWPTTGTQICQESTPRINWAYTGLG